MQAQAISDALPRRFNLTYAIQHTSQYSLFGVPSGARTCRDAPEIPARESFNSLKVPRLPDLTINRRIESMQSHILCQLIEFCLLSPLFPP